MLLDISGLCMNYSPTLQVFDLVNLDFSINSGACDRFNGSRLRVHCMDFTVTAKWNPENIRFCAIGSATSMDRQTNFSG